MLRRWVERLADNIVASTLPVGRAAEGNRAEVPEELFVSADLRKLARTEGEGEGRWILPTIGYRSHDRSPYRGSGERGGSKGR